MEKIEDSEAFSEANMDMTIQLYILTVHVLTGLIYMLQHHQNILQQNTQNTTSWRFHEYKNSLVFTETVPLQKFLFL